MRALLGLLLALPLGLAGCLGAPAAEVTPAAPVVDEATGAVFHGPGGALVAAPATSVVAAGVQRFTGMRAVEPTIGVDPDGVVFMTGIESLAGIRGRPTIVRSDDLGATWTDVGAAAHATTFDPYVYVDPATGRVFQDDIVAVGCGVLSFSDDKGASWITNPVACGNPQVNDHQTLVTAKPRGLTTVGYPNLVYRCVNNVAYPACAVSVNGGLTFLPQRPVVEELGVDPEYPTILGVAPVCSSLTGHLEAAPDGTVYLPLTDCTVMQSPPIVAITRDDGVTWEIVTISETHLSDDHDVGIAVDDAGNVFALWLTDGRVMLARSADAGATWSDAVDVTAPGVTATAFPAIAAGAAGKVAFAYIGTDVEGGYEGKETPDDWEGAVWNAYLGVVEDALAADVLVQSVRTNPADDPVARGICGNTRCRGMTDFIEIVIAPDGRPWASFVDVCNDACVTDPAEWSSGGNAGYAATLSAGPALRGEAAALVPIP